MLFSIRCIDSRASLLFSFTLHVFPPSVYFLLVLFASFSLLLGLSILCTLLAKHVFSTCCMKGMFGTRKSTLSEYEETPLDRDRPTISNFPRPPSHWHCLRDLFCISSLSQPRSSFIGIPLHRVSRILYSRSKQS